MKPSRPSPQWSWPDLITEERFFYDPAQLGR
jgi:hypothetical protein